MKIHIIETYKNDLITHGLHILKTSIDMDTAKKCISP